MDELKKLYLRTYFLINYKKSIQLENFICLIKTITDNKDIEQNIEKFCLFVKSLNKKDFTTILKDGLLADSTDNEKKIIQELSTIKYENLKSILIEKFKN